jgi:hypothetical protein
MRTSVKIVAGQFVMIFASLLISPMGHASEVCSDDSITEIPEGAQITLNQNIRIETNAATVDLLAAGGISTKTVPVRYDSTDDNGYLQTVTVNEARPDISEDFLHCAAVPKVVDTHSARVVHSPRKLIVGLTMKNQPVELEKYPNIKLDVYDIFIKGDPTISFLKCEAPVGRVLSIEQLNNVLMRNQVGNIKVKNLLKPAQCHQPKSASIKEINGALSELSEKTDQSRDSKSYDRARPSQSDTEMSIDLPAQLNEPTSARAI